MTDEEYRHRLRWERQHAARWLEAHLLAARRRYWSRQEDPIEHEDRWLRDVLAMEVRQHVRIGLSVRHPKSFVFVPPA